MKRYIKHGINHNVVPLDVCSVIVLFGQVDFEQFSKGWPFILTAPVSMVLCSLCADMLIKTQRGFEFSHFWHFVLQESVAFCGWNVH